MLTRFVTALAVAAAVATPSRATSISNEPFNFPYSALGQVYFNRDTNVIDPAQAAFQAAKVTESWGTFEVCSYSVDPALLPTEAPFEYPQGVLEAIKTACPMNAVEAVESPTATEFDMTLRSPNGFDASTGRCGTRVVSGSATKLEDCDFMDKWTRATPLLGHDFSSFLDYPPVLVNPRWLDPQLFDVSPVVSIPPAYADALNTDQYFSARYGVPDIVPLNLLDQHETQTRGQALGSTGGALLGGPYGTFASFTVGRPSDPAWGSFIAELRDVDTNPALLAELNITSLTDADPTHLIVMLRIEQFSVVRYRFDETCFLKCAVDPDGECIPEENFPVSPHNIAQNAMYSNLPRCLSSGNTVSDCSQVGFLYSSPNATESSPDTQDRLWWGLWSGPDVALVAFLVECFEPGGPDGGGTLPPSPGVTPSPSFTPNPVSAPVPTSAPTAAPTPANPCDDVCPDGGEPFDPCRDDRGWSGRYSSGETGSSTGSSSSSSKKGSAARGRKRHSLTFGKRDVLGSGRGSGSGSGMSSGSYKALRARCGSSGSGSSKDSSNSGFSPDSSGTGSGSQSLGGSSSRKKGRKRGDDYVLRSTSISSGSSTDPNTMSSSNSFSDNRTSSMSGSSSSESGDHIEDGPVVIDNPGLVPLGNEEGDPTYCVCHCTCPDGSDGVLERSSSSRSGSESGSGSGSSTGSSNSGLSLTTSMTGSGSSDSSDKSDDCSDADYSNSGFDCKSLMASQTTNHIFGWFKSSDGTIRTTVGSRMTEQPSPPFDSDEPLHVSCSDEFGFGNSNPTGYGEVDGPVQGTDLPLIDYVIVRCRDSGETWKCCSAGQSPPASSPPDVESGPSLGKRVKYTSDSDSATNSRTISSSMSLTNSKTDSMSGSGSSSSGGGSDSGSNAEVNVVVFAEEYECVCSSDGRLEMGGNETSSSRSSSGTSDGSKSDASDSSDSDKAPASPAPGGEDKAPRAPRVEKSTSTSKSHHRRKKLKSKSDKSKSSN